MQNGKGVYQIIKEVIGRLDVSMRWRFGAMVFALSVSAALETVALAFIAFYISTFVDPGKVLAVVDQLPEVLVRHMPQSDASLVVLLGGAAVAFLAVKSLVKLWVQFKVVKLTTQVDAYFGRLLLNGLLQTRYDWHALKNSADLVSMIDWRRFFGSGLLVNLLGISGDILFMIQVLVALLWIQPGVTLIVVLFVLALALPLYKLSQRAIDRAAKKRTQAHLALSRDVTTCFHGIKDVRIFGKEREFAGLYDEKAKSFSLNSAKLTFYSNIPGHGMEMVAVAFLVAVVSVMLLQLNLPMVKVVGVLAFFAVAAWRTMPALSRCLLQLANLRNSLPYAVEALNLLDEVEREQEHANVWSSLPKVQLKHRIELDKVSFSYRGSNKEVLFEIDQAIKAGSVVGVIGESGAGKSTVVDLVLGLLEPTSGEVRVDGTPLRGEHRLAWVRSVGYVPQAPYILDGTLAENIAFSAQSVGIDMERVAACASMAAMDFVAEYEDGFDQQIGERGARLSGGQRQRVAIARALYNTPQILVFDEATSSLDKNSEKRILDTIYGLKGEHTMLIVAHRLSTVELCDTVVWLDQGRVVLQGPPKVVLSAYAKAGN